MQRTRIHNAMVGELGERGLRGVTIAGVTARAGVSRATFYALYRDLDVCIMAVLRKVTSHSTDLIAAAFAREARWQDGVSAALAELLLSLDREPLLARVCLLETSAGSPAVLEHRARQMALLNPLVNIGRQHTHARREPPELAAEACVASIAGILHSRLVTGDAPPFIVLLGQLLGLVLSPYLEPCDVVREIDRAEQMAQVIATERRPTPAPSHIATRLPAGLQHPGAYRARLCVLFLAENAGASNKAVAAGIGVSSLGQASELLKRLAGLGLLTKRTGGAGHPNAWWLTPYGQQVVCTLRTGWAHYKSP
jgi:AcrR family transcriptional regulator